MFTWRRFYNSLRSITFHSFIRSLSSLPGKYERCVIHRRAIIEGKLRVYSERLSDSDKRTSLEMLREYFRFVAEAELTQKMLAKLYVYVLILQVFSCLILTRLFLYICEDIRCRRPSRLRLLFA
jgi:hypothetical protein